MNHKKSNRMVILKMKGLNEMTWIYVYMSLLNQMRKRLGLEAMLCYLDRYLLTMNKKHALLNEMITSVLENMDVEEICKEMMAE